MSNAADNESRERRLDEAVADYMRRRGSGQDVDRQQWLSEHPDLAEELTDFLRDLDQLQPLNDLLATDVLAASREFHAKAMSGHPIVGSKISIGKQPSQGTAGRYLTRDFLAAGGMGEVWLAEDSHIGRRIAVKRIRHSHYISPAAESRFLFESQVMGQLEHPCIVPLHDLGRDEAGRLYSVMKLVRGHSLKERLAKFHSEKSEDWPRLVEFRRMLEAFISICHAVAYAHSRGILHRDIKPDNIMLGNYGEAMLLDWGLAKALDIPDDAVSAVAGSERVRFSTGNSTATQAGAVMGSPVYMAPEVAAGKSDSADERTDVYLLGATLYELLTGEPPRLGNSAAALIELAKQTPPTPPRHHDRRIPKGLDAICLRAMALQPEQRYESANALARDLENFLAGEPVSACQESWPLRSWRWCRRHRRGLNRTLVAGTILAVATAAVFDHRRAARLEAREVSRIEFIKFQHLADEVQFFAANTDPAGEQAPYYDPKRGIELGATALAMADRWGADGSRFPLLSEQAAFRTSLEEMLLVLANLHLRSGEKNGPSEAMSLLDRAANLRPASRSLRQLRSDCFKQLGRAEDAVEKAQPGSDEDSKANALDWFIEGELKRTGTISGARSSEVLEFNRDDAKNILDAIDAYQQALWIDPDHYWARYQLARCYLRLRRGGEAVEALGACIAVRPDVPWAYSTRGLTRALLGDFEKAEADLEEALRLASEFRPAQLNHGVLRMLQDRDEEAMAEFDQLLKPPLESALIEAAFYRAQIHARHRSFPAALRDVELFLASRPDFASAHSLRAVILFSMGRDDQGITSIDQMISLISHDTSSFNDDSHRVSRARVLRALANSVDSSTKQRMLQQALHDLESAAPDVAQDDLITIRDLLGQSEQVVEAYSLRLDVAPLDVHTRKMRAWNYVKQERYDLALADFQTVIRQEPEDAEAHAGFGIVKAMLGERKPAEEAAINAMMYTYLALHNVACIYAELAATNSSDSGRMIDENRAITCLQEAIAIFRRCPGGFDEVDQIRNETSFHDSLKARPEFQQLLR